MHDAKTPFQLTEEAKVDNAKQQALKLISQLPDDSSWDDILAELKIKKKDTLNDAAAKVEEKRPLLNEFIGQLKNVLQAEFPSAQEIILEPASDGERVKGMIISEGFSGMDDADRQDHVWDILEEKLTQTEQRRVLSLIAYTPAEYREFKEE
jgi:acid stress-induced BolA-like protein IbaG/YrbA